MIAKKSRLFIASFFGGTNQVQYSNLEFLIGITSYYIRYFRGSTYASIG